MKKNNYYFVAILSIASLIGGFLNYLYSPLLLRFMSLEDFGVFGSLLGLINLIGVVLTGYIMFLNTEISRQKDDLSKVQSIFQNALKISVVLGGGVYIFYSLCIPLLSSFLKIEEYGYFFLLGSIIVLGFLSTGITSTLRGLQKYEFLSLSQVIPAFLKLSIGMILLLLGYNIYGALMGVILSGVIWFFISYLFLTRSIGKQKKSSQTLHTLLGDLKKQRYELFQFVSMSFLFALAMNMDILLVKNIFSETDAGIYAAVGVLGKFLIFLLLSIETVYYSQIIEHDVADIPRHLLRNPLILITCVIIFTLIVNLFFGNLFLALLHPELKDALSLYMQSLVYYGSLAYISFSHKLLTAWKCYQYSKYFLYVLLLCIVSLYIFGSSSLLHFVTVLSVYGVLGAMLLSFFLFYELKKHRV